MKKLLAVAVLLLVFAVQPANAVTVLYQPTPYPDKKMDGTAMPTDLAIRHFWEGWLPSVYYGQTLQQDDKFQVGGWGDWYYSFIKFDLAGLPQHADYAYIYLMPFSPGGSSTPISFSACDVTTSWNLSLTWNTQPSYGACWGYPAPTVGSWTGFWIGYPGYLDWYNQWQNGSFANNGVALLPNGNNNNFDMFRNSRYSDYISDPDADGKRPMLYLNFTQPAGMPNFKMPLPNAVYWLVTNEVGGYECTGQAPFPDSAHQGNNYFSIDFSYRNRDGNGNTVYSGNIPILAAAGGPYGSSASQAKVIDVGGSPNDSRGYYITLDHGNGYQTRYLHFQAHAARKNGQLLSVGDFVSQGDQIGIMGETGNASGVHLHINFWQNGTGTSSSNLSYAVMEGLLLKSYQTECSVDSNGIPTGWIRYYPSSNVPTGN